MCSTGLVVLPALNLKSRISVRALFNAATASVLAALSSDIGPDKLRALSAEFVASVTIRYMEAGRC
jgi:hypothetical protein